MRQLRVCLPLLLVCISCSRTEQADEAAWRSQQFKAIEARAQLEKLIVAAPEVHQQEIAIYYASPSISFTIENRTTWVIGEALFVATIYDNHYKPMSEEFMCKFPDLRPGQKAHADASPFANWAATRKVHQGATISVAGLYSRDKKVLASNRFPYDLYPAKYLLTMGGSPCFVSVD